MSIRLTRETFALPRAPEPDVEIFAFGDIHGRSDLLGALMEAAASEPKRASRRTVVFLGDIIDRGPDSLGAIALSATAAASLGADEVVRLLGNHEQLMRMALTGETPEAAAREAFEVWRSNGGEHVIAEFPDLRVVSRDSASLLLSAREALPTAARDYLTSLQPHWRSGSLLFVHAGVNPAQPLETALAAPWDVPLSELDQDAHWAWSARPSSIISRAMRDEAAISSCTATRRTTGAGGRRTPTSCEASASTSMAAPASPGLAGWRSCAAAGPRS